MKKYFLVRLCTPDLPVFAERRNFRPFRGYLALKLGRLTPAMIVAWSEIGVMFIDEFGMVKAELYDLTVVCSPAPLVAAAISALDFLSCLYVEKCF
jgi:hypothetical protein